MGLGWILSPNLIDQRHNGMSANAPHLWRWQHPLPLNLYLHLVIHEIAKEPRKGMKPEKLRLKKEKLIVTPPSALNYMQKLKKKKKLCSEVVGKRLSLKSGCHEISGTWDRVWKWKRMRPLWWLDSLNGEAWYPHSLWELVLGTYLNSATLIARMRPRRRGTVWTWCKFTLSLTLQGPSNPF